MAEKNRKKARVAVIKTSPETILEDYSRLLELIDYKKHIPKKNKTLLKLNLSWSLYYPACSTQPWQLEGVLKKLKEDNYENLHIVENKTVVTDVMKGAKQNKWIPIIEKYNEKFEPLTDVKWVSYRPKCKTPALDSIFGKTHKIPAMFIGKNVIHFPTIKTHGHTTMTGAMKNAFGGLITTRRHHCHKMIHEVLVDLLAIQKEIHPGMIAVMDGTVAGDGAGPRTMNPVIKNYILASNDMVAIDAISAKMMGYDPMKIKFIKMAHDRKLGIGNPDEIEIVGDSIKGINFNFKTSKSPVIFWDQMLRKGPLSFVEPLLFHTGLFKIPVFASAFYHDRIWYPLVGKRKIKRFMKTEWGRIWEEYK